MTGDVDISPDGDPEEFALGRRYRRAFFEYIRRHRFMLVGRLANETDLAGNIAFFFGPALDAETEPALDCPGFRRDLWPGLSGGLAEILPQYLAQVLRHR